MFGAGTPPGSGSPASAPDEKPASQVGASPSPASKVSIYKPSVTGTALRQGEVLTRVFQYRRSIVSLKARTHELEEIQHPYAVVMSPDCDLEQDFAERSSRLAADKLIPSVLLLQAITVDELRVTAPPGKDIWKRIRQNKDERYHVLEALAAEDDAFGEGLPALGIDFKRYFTVPTDELYEQLSGTGKRHCYVEPPYAEHLNRRFTDFLSRVALPREHQVE